MDQPRIELRGARVMVTGASGGLGAAICSELARRGAELVLTARRRELLVDLAARTGGEVVVADLADRLDVDRLTEEALGCDVLVLNAGVGNDGPLEEVTADGADLVMDVNLRAPVQMSLAFVQHALAERRRAAVVTVGSLSGIVATPNTRMYNATKFGLRGFTLSLHQDLLGTPVHASLVAPGFIRDAGMFAENDIELPPGVRTKSPQDVADAVVRAIVTGDAEVFAAPPELRAVAKFSGLLPGLSASIQRRLGVSDRTAAR
jgi:short-subunit dehydrogenase